MGYMHFNCQQVALACIYCIVRDFVVLAMWDVPIYANIFSKLCIHTFVIIISLTQSMLTTQLLLSIMVCLLKMVHTFVTHDSITVEY